MCVCVWLEAETSRRADANEKRALDESDSSTKKTEFLPPLQTLPMSRQKSLVFKSVYFVGWFASFHFILVFLVCSVSLIRSFAHSTKASLSAKRKADKRRFGVLFCVFLFESASAPFVYTKSVPFMCLPTDGTSCLHSYNWMEQLPRCEVTGSSPPLIVCKDGPLLANRWWRLLVAATQSVQLALLSFLLAGEKNHRQGSDVTTLFFFFVSLVVLVLFTGDAGPPLLFAASCCASLVCLHAARSGELNANLSFLTVLHCAQGLAALSSLEGAGPLLRLVALGLKLAHFVVVVTPCGRHRVEKALTDASEFDNQDATASYEAQLRAEEKAFSQTQGFIEVRS